MAIRFHLDEHVSPAIAEALRTHGVNVSTTEDAGLLGAADEEHLAFALREDRVVVTQDRDFLRIAASGKPHAGIIFVVANRISIGEYVRSLLLFDACCEPAELYGAVQYL